MNIRKIYILLMLLSISSTFYIFTGDGGHSSGNFFRHIHEELRGGPWYIRLLKGVFRPTKDDIEKAIATYPHINHVTPQDIKNAYDYTPKRSTLGEEISSIVDSGVKSSTQELGRTLTHQYLNQHYISDEKIIDQFTAGRNVTKEEFLAILEFYKHTNNTKQKEKLENKLERYSDRMEHSSIQNHYNIVQSSKEEFVHWLIKDISRIYDKHKKKLNELDEQKNDGKQSNYDRIYEKNKRKADKEKLEFDKKIQEKIKNKELKTQQDVDNYIEQYASSRYYKSIEERDFKQDPFVINCNISYRDYKKLINNKVKNEKNENIIRAMSSDDLVICTQNFNRIKEDHTEIIDGYYDKIDAKSNDMTNPILKSLYLEYLKELQERREHTTNELDDTINDTYEKIELKSDIDYENASKNTYLKDAKRHVEKHKEKYVAGILVSLFVMNMYSTFFK